MRKGIVIALALVPAGAVAGAGADPAAVPAGAVEILGGTSLKLSQGSGTVKMDQPGPNRYTTSSDEYGVQLVGLYYVLPNVGVGLGGGWSYEQQSTEGIPKQGGGNVSLQDRVRTWTIGPTVAVQLPVSPSLALSARGEVAYAAANTSGLDQPEVKGSGVGLSIGAGIKYFPVAQVSINAGVTYAYLRLKTDAVADPNYGAFPSTTTTASDLTVSAGLSVYFGR